MQAETLFVLSFFILSIHSLPLSPSSSKSKNLIYAPSNTPTRSQTPDAPWFTPQTRDPSLFCYAGLSTVQLQLYAMQVDGWLPIQVVSTYLWQLQTLNYFNLADRTRGLTYTRALMTNFVKPYDITPWEPPTFPMQSRFDYSDAFLTTRLTPWPSILTAIVMTLSFPGGPLNYTQLQASYYYGNLTLAIISLSTGVGVFDQLTFELTPPTTPSLPIVWVLFDPEFGCQIPTRKFLPHQPLSIHVPCHWHLYAYNTYTNLKGICPKLIPGNCSAACCCVNNYQCDSTSSPISSCTDPSDDTCCLSNTVFQPASCNHGSFSVSLETCLGAYNSDSVTSTPTRTPSSTPTISDSNSASRSPFTPTSSSSLSRTPTASPSLSITPTNSPLSVTPTHIAPLLVPGNCTNSDNGCCCLQPYTCILPTPTIPACSDTDDYCCITAGLMHCPDFQPAISYHSCRLYFSSDSPTPSISASVSLSSTFDITHTPTNSPSLSATPTTSIATRTATATNSISLTPTSSTSLSSSNTPSNTATSSISVTPTVTPTTSPA